MKELSLHVLDIVQNSIVAGADEIRIDIEEVLEGTSVSEPGVLKFVREMIGENLAVMNTGKNI